jgi:phosphopantothenoylcysteine decarboxylase / phosphopantothenate---cysteine ligase
VQSTKVLLGVSGGIAAYKAAELVRRLRETGAEVRVVMTASAQAFVAPLTFQALSGQEVRSELLDARAEAGMGHIELARWADLILIAPATADVLARLAHGLADDLLTTLVLASAAPLLVAPAMNQAMWRHPATQDNLRTLRGRGVWVLGPAEGGQACGDAGPGRMLEPTEIVAALSPRCTLPAGCRVLVTAGPTREPLDPVRFLGNRSSGRMGYAVAQALVARGADVCLVSGPSALEPPALGELVRVETAAEMHAAVMARVGGCGIFVAVAAVADYRPVAPQATKIKKSEDEMTLRLAKNPDILAEVAALPGGPFTVGFAAETEQVEAHARSKLKAKGLDMIAANLVGAPAGGPAGDQRGGFDSEDNALLVLWEGGSRSLPFMPKRLLGAELADLICERYLASTSG